MDALTLRVASRYEQALRLAKKVFELSWYNLEGLATGQPVTLYHGSSRLFHKFDMGKSRNELVDNYYGAGIFLTPSKVIAERYANANRNIGFEPDLINDLKRKNKAAGGFMEDLYHRGIDAWDTVFAKAKAAYPELDPGIATDKYLGVDSNLVDDVCGYIIGSKIKPLGTDAPTLFSQSSGAPDWLYDNLDTLGIDSSKYRPKVYTVVVTVRNPLITASKSQAKSARQKGFDSVVFYGSDLVSGIPEVAVFNPSDVKIRNIEVVYLRRGSQAVRQGSAKPPSSVRSRPTTPMSIIQRVVARFKGKSIPSRDWEDAFFVLENWPYWNWVLAVDSLRPIFDRARHKAQVEQIPVSSIKTHSDWGRVPTSESLQTPIIVMELPGGNYKYVVLDGQHRVFQHKRLGLDTISACVLHIPLKYGLVDGQRMFVLDL